ncbi:LCP family protein [Actinomadura rudentiformis]|uniref:LytR family transcriptional regulator n=1 Tax=Actinomadura rudentiformis TaxID=359158 RepID=A0A6H9YU09_9ACTN|nr:LCP family protein [Actinomadura rudentiformis]KAB2347853.1 LytR family transcriptional regulator [Actinomadura rudentiformis]
MQRLAEPDNAFWGDEPAPHSPRHQSRPPSRGRGWRVLGWVSIAVSVLMVIGSLGAYMTWRSLDGQIDRENVDDKLGDKRPAKLNNSMNILLMGSDTRAGENARYGAEGGERSDTTILLHISPGGERAIGISFPRDTMVQMPSCTKRDGGKSPPQLAMMNAAYSIGGPACTWKTIEATTDIRIDHYVEVDFSGFKRVVDALDGVEICVPRAINDPKAELVLKKGRQTVRGDQALGYVRTRTGGLGDGSDLSRIQRQQAFMASVVKKATDKGMLTDPGKAYGFLSAATKSIKADDRLTLSVMQKLAGSLKGMSAGKVRFVTVPVQAYPQDKNRVQFNMALASPLFQAIKQDNTLPEPAPPPVPAQQPGAKVPVRPVKPSKVQVAVYNATKTDGLGQRTAEQLEEKGFKVAKVGTKKAPAGFKTQILYGPGGERQAAALAAALPGHPPRAYAAGKPGLVYLVIGKDGAVMPGAGRPLPKIAGELRADRDVCAQT